MLKAWSPSQALQMMLESAKKPSLMSTFSLPCTLLYGLMREAGIGGSSHSVQLRGQRGSKEQSHLVKGTVDDLVVSVSIILFLRPYLPQSGGHFKVDSFGRGTLMSQNPRADSQRRTEAAS